MDYTKLVRLDGIVKLRVCVRRPYNAWTCKMDNSIVKISVLEDMFLHFTTAILIS